MDKRFSTHFTVLLTGVAALLPGFAASPACAKALTEVWQPGAESSGTLEPYPAPGRSGNQDQALAARAIGRQDAWRTEAPVSPGGRWLASCWLYVESGSAWLELRQKTPGGNVEVWATARLSQPGQWTYVAIETAPLGPEADTLDAVFVVEDGAARLDDARFHSASPPFIAHGNFSAPMDSRGRVPFWSPEEHELLPGASVGGLTLDSDNPGEGDASAALTTTGDWFAAASVNYAIPAWTDRYALTALARTGPGAEAAIAIVWTDSDQGIIGVEFGPFVGSEAWTTLELGPLAPPAGAAQMRPVLLVRNITGAGQPAGAWFDAVDIRSLAPGERRVKVLVNQAGYDRQAPKSFVAATNFFPRNCAEGTFSVVYEDGTSAFEGTLTGRGRMYGQEEADWGWYFWRGDFSNLTAPGVYRLRAGIDGVTGESVPFELAQDQLYRKTGPLNVEFFHVQRCGYDVQGWHAACHLDAARLPDGAHLELAGGWHSAGDYNKLMWEYGDGGVAYALVSAYETMPEFWNQPGRTRGDLPKILDEARWGADFLAKMQRADGGFLHHIEQGPNRSAWMRWCPPEEATDNVPGTSDDPIVIEGEGKSPLAIGAWARLGRMLSERGIENEYRARAIRAWEYAVDKAGEAGDPLLLISSVDLHRVTGEQRFLDYARSAAQALLDSGGGAGQLAGGYGNSGDIPAAALAYFALTLPDETLATVIRARLEQHVPAFVAEAGNALGIMMQEPGETGYYFDPSSTLGCNNQFASRAWSALLVYRVTGDERALAYAADQLDFILGKNPYDLCMMESAGTHHAPRYHHRYNTIPGRERGAVPGAIPNGMVRDIGGFDRPGFDLTTGGRPYPSYRTSEPWLVHNVLYTLAIAAWHDALEERR